MSGRDWLIADIWYKHVEIYTSRSRVLTSYKYNMMHKNNLIYRFLLLVVFLFL